VFVFIGVLIARSPVSAWLVDSGWIDIKESDMSGKLFYFVIVILIIYGFPQWS